MNAICLLVDRLHRGFLGAYGNTWVQTPHFDRLAVESLVCDQAMIDQVRLESLCRGWWQGRFGCDQTTPPDATASLPRRLAEQGVHSLLLSDDPAVTRHPLAADFAEIVELRPSKRRTPARRLDDTHLAACFARIVQELPALPEPFLLWVHLAGLGQAWDAPKDLRRLHWEEGDPEPTDSTAVARQRLEENHDPDEVWRVVQTYTGQIAVWDECLGAFTEFFDESGLSEKTLLLLSAARGMPLGEHQRLGPCDESLYAPTVHIPLVLRFPDGLAAAVRTGALVQPSDVHDALAAWLAHDSAAASPGGLLALAKEEVEAIRDRVCMVDGDGPQWAIRTPAWHLRMAEEAELFAKPDDVWEVNNVAQRCPEVVEGLRAAFEASCAAAGRGEPLPPLDERLLTLPE